MTSPQSSTIDRLSGPGVVLRGADIDTDRIIPARFLKSITFAGLEQHVFADDRAEARAQGRQHPFDAPERRHARVLVGGANFGCGSSREHAPRALQRWGIRAVVAETFAEIFAGNALMIGLPCVTVGRDDAEALRLAIEADATAEVVVDLRSNRVTIGALDVAASMPDATRSALLSGHWDATGLLLENYEEVLKTTSSIPYLNHFDMKEVKRV